MSLTATFRTAAATIMRAAGDTKVTCVYTHVPEVTTGPDYDPITDTVAVTTQEYTFEAFLSGLRKVDMDWLADAGDETIQKLVVDYAGLPVDEPTNQDSVVINSQTWQVIRARPLPARAAHILFIRRT
jgi:hypothetical protein